jgi:DNA-binding MarR family transcriptional regulator
MAEAPAKAPISDEQLAAWRAFLRAHSTMLRRISSDLDEAGLPPLTWYDVLAALRDAPERSLRQVELAERVLLSNSGLSRLVDRIERGGLVERTACPTDRRSFHVRLTDAGGEMLERIWPVYARGIAEDFLPALGGNPCEIRQMLETIGRTCDAAREAEATDVGEPAARA